MRRAAQVGLVATTTAIVAPVLQHV
jgi:hypothetical protein